MNSHRKSFSTRQGGVCRALILALSGFAGLMISGCADDDTYAYFAVQVGIDPASVNEDLRKTIASCSLRVEGDDNDSTVIPCEFTKVPYELGIVEYSTNKRRGQLVFVAIMRDLNNAVVAQGSSQPMAIVQNLKVPTSTSVVAYRVDGTVADAGTDTGTPNNSPDGRGGDTQ